jgi:hypothetical protein
MKSDQDRAVREVRYGIGDYGVIRQSHLKVKYRSAEVKEVDT